MHVNNWNRMQKCSIFGGYFINEKNRHVCYIWAATWDFQQCGMCDQQKFRPACAYAQSGQSLYLSLKFSMNIKLLTEHHLDFISLKGGRTGSFESTLVEMTHCWKSHVAAYIILLRAYFHKMWDIGMRRIGTNFSRAVRNWYQFFMVWNLWSVKFVVQHSIFMKFK